MMQMYRWYYEEQYKQPISGACMAESDEEAIEDVKAYLIDRFSDIEGEMNFVTSVDEACIDEYNEGITLFVWKCTEDDDYHSAHPNCIAVNY